MATTPRRGDPMPNTMKAIYGNTHKNQDGTTCEYPVTNFYSYDTLMCQVCQHHGVIYSNTKQYSPTTRRHQTWIAAHYQQYAAAMEQADKERKKATGRKTKTRFTSVSDAIA